MFVKNGKVSKAVSTFEQFNDCLIVVAEFIEIFVVNIAVFIAVFAELLKV